MGLFIGLSPIDAVANMPIHRLSKIQNSILGKERVGLLFRDPQALKKKRKSSTFARGYNERMYRRAAAVREQKVPSWSASAPSWLAEAQKSRRGVGRSEV